MFLLAFPVLAQDNEPPPPPKHAGVRITFLPPPLEGTLSLGIFNKAGKLVRTLHREAKTDDFTVGLNGLITFWDGKDDAGAVAPAGKYFARGYAVGAIEFEGEAFHFNDWISDDGTPRLKRVNDLRVEGEGLRLLAESADGAKVTFIAEPDGQLRDVQPQSDATPFFHPMNAPVEAKATDGKWPAIREEAARFAGKPVNALDGEDLILAIAEGRLLLRERDSWRWLDLPGLEKVITGCLGRDQTIWVIARTDTGVEVQQYSFGGEFRRRLAIAVEDPAPVRIAASTDADAIALLEESPSVQRVRMLTLVTGDPAPAGGKNSSTWKVTFSKSIRASADPGDVRDALKTQSGAPFVPDEKITIRLLPNQLLRNASTNVEVAVGFDAKGSFLRTVDGLALKQITETPNLRWIAMMREPSSRAVTVFQSDGAVVEEFKARRLANMMAFDAGDYEWAGK